jgi:hypothetical protein
MIEEKPDGWHYRWLDLPDNGGEAVEWSAVKPTFDEALIALERSIRERKPVGSLQNDGEIPTPRFFPDWTAAEEGKP